MRINEKVKAALYSVVFLVGTFIALSIVCTTEDVESTEFKQLPYNAVAAEKNKVNTEKATKAQAEYQAKSSAQVDSIKEQVRKLNEYDYMNCRLNDAGQLQVMYFGIDPQVGLTGSTVWMTIDKKQEGQLLIDSMNETVDGLNNKSIEWPKVAVNELIDCINIVDNSDWHTKLR